MPITFGAVGDIISVGLLVKDLIATLDEARGSKAEYRAAVQAIRTLNDTIEIVNQHVIQQGVATQELCNLCEAARQAVAVCRSSGDAFLKRIRRYRTAFDISHKSNKLKQTAMAVRWRLGEKEALERFHREILDASVSLQTLLATANFTLLGVNQRILNDKLDEAKRENETAFRSHDAALDGIKDGINDVRKDIEARTTILAKVAEALKSSWIRQLDSELGGLMRGVMAVNFATYRAIIRLETALTSRVERPLFEESVILDDPIDRIVPVPLQLITSWDAFHAVLEARFQHMPGYEKMRQRRYSLQAGGTVRDIEQSCPWQHTFLPGQRIEMSFIFDDNSGGNTCPGCHAPSEYSGDADTRCSTCGLSFRRIQEFRDISRPEETTAPQNNVGSTNHKRTSSHGFKEHEDVTRFKRVRLVKEPARFAKKQHIFDALEPGKYVLCSRVRNKAWNLHTVIDQPRCPTCTVTKVQVR